ncbi:MAG TPA: hypothetical protein VF667_13345, partial [Pseudonocardia sp.]
PQRAADLRVGEVDRAVAGEAVVVGQEGDRIAVGLRAVQDADTAGRGRPEPAVAPVSPLGGA